MAYPLTLESTPTLMLDIVSPMTVSKLADEVGTSSDTVRYYERIGLLPAPERSPAGYRLYGDDAVERVRFIKRAKRLGLRLEEVGELLAIRERGMCPCGSTRRMLEDRVAELTGEMAALRRLRDDIQQMLDDNLPAADDDGWHCGSALIQIGKRSTESQGERYECF